MNKDKLRNRAINFLSGFGENIKAKLTNISGKTGQYNVPDELYQKRTHRKNRVLISWKVVKKNGLTIEQLESFSGGVAVEFVNEDYFLEENQENPVFVELKNRIGSDERVSAIITIRSESGSSSSAVQRRWFQELLNNTEVKYRGQTVLINESNYKNYAVRQIRPGGIGNDKWDGFLYVSIRGGQQDTIGTHDEVHTLFNAACEFANPSVSCDLDLVMIYFTLASVDEGSLEADRQVLCRWLKSEIEKVLASAEYESDAYTGNLYDYCVNHPSMKMVPGRLYDPIQVEAISIFDFNIKNKHDLRNLDFTHDEAVNFDNYYWDTKQKTILSPARPTNVFWSKHLSNMMQQNYSLDGYFAHEEQISIRRKSLLEKKHAD